VQQLVLAQVRHAVSVVRAPQMQGSAQESFWHSPSASSAALAIGDAVLHASAHAASAHGVMHVSNASTSEALR
jgi:hypothetical protein